MSLTNTLITKTVITVKSSRLDNETLMAANNGINGLDVIDVHNMAYKFFYTNDLIVASGKPKDEFLGEILSTEVMKRVKEGTFN